MFSFKVIWVLPILLSSSGRATGNCDHKCSQHHSNLTAGLNKQCGGESLRIVQLTDALRVGESPFWDKDTGSVLFVDNFASEVHRFVVNENRHYRAKLGNKNAGAIIPIEGRPGQFVITYGDELCVLCWNGVSENVTLKCFRQPEPSRPWPKYHLSDAKVAPNKALFFFNVPPWKGYNGVNESSLFSIAHGEQKTLAVNLNFGQGTGWSGDGKWFYWMDSYRYAVYKSFYNQANNSIENTRVLLDYKKLGIGGAPDSLTVDADGYVWLACNGVYLILKLDPNNGNVLCSIKLPALQVSNLCFGKCRNERKNDDELKCLYVTTTSTNEAPTKYDGAFYRIENVGSRGVLPDKIRLSDVLFLRHSLSIPSFNFTLPPSYLFGRS